MVKENNKSVAKGSVFTEVRRNNAAGVPTTYAVIWFSL